VKYLGHWPASRIMLIRFSIDLLICTVLAVGMRLKLPRPRVCGLLLVRGACYCIAIWLLWQGLRSCAPLGDTSALMLVAPFWLALLARVLLGEKLSNRMPLQFVLCVVGALMINPPVGFHRDCPSSAMLPSMYATWAFSFMNLLSRYAKDAPSIIVQAFNDIMVILFASLIAVFEDVAVLPPAFDKDFVLVILAALIGFLGLYCNVKGYQTVTVGAVAGFVGYTAIPFSYCLQVIVFSQPPNLLSVSGALLIITTSGGMLLEKYRAYKAMSDSDLATPIVCKSQYPSSMISKGHNSDPICLEEDDIMKDKGPSLPAIPEVAAGA